MERSLAESKTTLAPKSDTTTDTEIRELSAEELNCIAGGWPPDPCKPLVH
jgi:hypothetical protein